MLRERGRVGHIARKVRARETDKAKVRARVRGRVRIEITIRDRIRDRILGWTGVGSRRAHVY